MFDFENVKSSEVSDFKYIKHGVSEIKIPKVEHLELSGANYTGEAADIHFIDNTGNTSSVRMFPFNYSDKANKYEKGKVVGVKTKEEQFIEWQGRVKHLFTKALGEENFSKAVKGVKDFKGLVRNLNNACEKAGIKFAGMFVSDSKGYAKIPFGWTGGFVSTLENIETLKDKYNSNLEKYGPKSAPTTGIEAPASTSTDLNDLFSQVSSPTTNAFVAPEVEDDLPF